MRAVLCPHLLLKSQRGFRHYVDFYLEFLQLLVLL